MFVLIGGRSIRVDWGHLAFLTAMVAAIAFYLVDALSVSTKLENVALVLPASIFAFILYVGIAATAIRVERCDHQSASAKGGDGGGGEGDEQSTAELIRAAILMLGLGAYVVLYPVLGLEPATFLFIASGLWLLGMRRPVFVLIYGVIFTVVVIGGSRALLSYPMPLAFF
jgi:hypothetical protein